MCGIAGWIEKDCKMIERINDSLHAKPIGAAMEKYIAEFKEVKNGLCNRNRHWKKYQCS